MSAPLAAASLACANVCTWQMSSAPPRLIFSACGRTSPNDRKIAAGRCSSARSSSRGLVAMLQVMKPTPIFASPAACSSRVSHSSSPYPPPTIPKPPACVAVAASLPSATRSIGASRIGCLIPSSVVARVDMVMIVMSRAASRSAMRILPEATPQAASKPNEPRPPASAMATDSAGAGTPAIGASRIGRRRLKRAQNALVRSRRGLIRRILAHVRARHNSHSASVPFEPDECAELLRRGARRAEAVGGMFAVAPADGDGTEQHVGGRDRQELADDLVHARPRFLRAGVEAVAARQIHQGVDVAAEIGPLTGAELTLDGDEQRDRRVEELEIALVLVEPALGVVARDLERAIELHAVLLAPRPV